MLGVYSCLTNTVKLIIIVIISRLFLFSTSSQIYAVNVRSFERFMSTVTINAFVLLHKVFCSSNSLCPLPFSGVFFLVCLWFFLTIDMTFLQEVPPDNEFEKRIRPEVIPANEIGVTFADVGAMDDIKESLQELVMLPLQRPDLFNGGLLKPCRGILLFGPPGTGKTMLAKAIANEAGASFINVSMSTITSKWFGEDEKNVRALFTLAAKVAPTIIFVDEVDSMLGQRTRVGEHEAMRKIKNEFMTHWDGLLTKAGERVLVLAATNRPFDLDEAIIRRFERRYIYYLSDILDLICFISRIL